jgi:hypothetical protein
LSKVPTLSISITRTRSESSAAVRIQHTSRSKIEVDLNLHLPEWKRLSLERLDDRSEGREFRPFDVDLRFLR